LQGKWHHKELTQTYRHVYRSPHFIFLSTKIFQEWATSQIHCKCPPGQEFDEKNSTNNTCIDFSSFGTRHADCKKRNAECKTIMKQILISYASVEMDSTEIKIIIVNINVLLD
jgi:hypothetical protein